MTPETAVARSTTADDLEHPSTSEPARPSGRAPDHLAVVSLRVARSSEPIDARRVADAFREGAEAYLVTTGDPEADLAFLRRALGGGPPYEAML